ncbi:MAG TPA: bifunctional hydroxymethylpyrimidine kinase/phosphomethylpyrimidine kinase [Thermoplasmatales archaeon]|nr:bifunctional hydroxymethylpyrimidine kinase/phosphomethylpyrimidine kinase [Thermoplasmatales archaeon]
MRNVVLSIAGLDPSGGAGLTMDIKTLTSIGVEALSIATCLTTQNTREVKNVEEVSDELVAKQIDLLMEDIPIEVVKIGLLPSVEMIKIIASKTQQHKWKVILDPIFTSTTGYSFYDHSMIESLKKDLLPYVYLLTPNKSEAERIVGWDIKTRGDAETVCNELYSMGCRNILLKSSYGRGVDLFYDGRVYVTLSLPKHPLEVHGTGCVLSSLIAGFLSKGYSLMESIKKAKSILWGLMLSSRKIGGGLRSISYPSNSFVEESCMIVDEVHAETLLELKSCLEELLSILSIDFVPEVGCNIGYATPSARSKEDVCAISGRIVRVANSIRCCGPLSFGVSKHISSIILSAMKHYSYLRSAMNIKYDPKVIDAAEREGLKVGFFSREDEPVEVSSTMEWGTSYAFTRAKQPLDIIYDEGGIGKEPMIRILARNPREVLDKLRLLQRI